MKDFKQLERQLLAKGEKKRIAVVNGGDCTTRGAVALALEAGFAEAIFVGAHKEVAASEAITCHAPLVSIFHATDPVNAAAKAVALARDGKADVIMKGLLNTDNLLRAILNRETGILPKGEILTHITVGEIPTYHKLLLFSDVAVIPYDALRLYVGYNKNRDSMLVEVKDTILEFFVDKKGEPIEYSYTDKKGETTTYLACQMIYQLGKIIEKDIHPKNKK